MMPLQACVGGLFIGAACGAYMILVGRIAGNSGVMKALVNGPREPAKIAFMAGLMAGGALMMRLLPGAFEVARAPSLAIALSGLAVGLGVSLGNGCTSGHGLCGLSRFSLRSLAAVPTFMGVAIVAATLTTYSGTIGSPLAITPTPQPTIDLAAKLAATLAVAVVPAFVLKGTLKETYASLWVGACFAVGLSVGGMVRPSVVINALSPVRFDATLWILFVTALATTFALYRVATAVGVKGASCLAPGGSQGAIDAKLLTGAALFGLGWGSGGVCPGPQLVSLAADPTAPGPLLMLAAVVVGIRLSGQFARALGLETPPVTPASAADFAAWGGGKGGGNATLVDLRPLSPAEATDGGHFEAVVGALSAPWDKSSGTMPLGALPADKSHMLILHCRSGNRVQPAAAYLRAHGFSRVVSAGGPIGPADTWRRAHRDGALLHRHELGIFRQLFDGAPPTGGGSSTYTYLLGDAASGEAILIDPVLEHVDRDLTAISELGLELTLALNTHCHADHITGSGALKRRVAAVESLISKASGARADRHVSDGDVISWAGGRRQLKVLATPGHTNGCVSFYDESIGAAFTGDALFIGGCGRTDFQEGSAATLYESVHTKLFTLPAGTLVLPAHDYKGRAYATVGAEAATNPRLTKPKAGFVQLMAGLQLAYPRKLDVSLPANLKCGLD